MRADATARLVLLAAVTVLAGGAAYWHYRAVSVRQEAIRALQDERDRAEAAAATLPEQTARRGELRRSLRAFARQVPDQADVGPLLEELRPGQAGDEVVEREMSTRPVVTEKYLSRTPVSIRLKSSFTGMLLLLEEIEAPSRLARVERIVAERPAGERDKPLQVQIEFSAFFRGSEDLAKWARTDQ